MVVAVLRHVTVERRHFGMQCSETATANSSKPCRFTHGALIATRRHILRGSSR